MSARNLLLLTVTFFCAPFGYEVSKEHQIVAWLLYLLAFLCLSLILWDFWKKRKYEYLRSDQPPLPEKLIPFEEGPKKGVITHVSTNGDGTTHIVQHSASAATSTTVVTSPHAPTGFWGYIKKQIIITKDGSKTIEPR